MRQGEKHKRKTIKQAETAALLTGSSVAHRKPLFNLRHKMSSKRAHFEAEGAFEAPKTPVSACPRPGNWNAPPAGSSTPVRGSSILHIDVALALALAASTQQ